MANILSTWRDLQTWDALASLGGLLGREKGLPRGVKGTSQWEERAFFREGLPGSPKAKGTSQWGEGTFPNKGSPQGAKGTSQHGERVLFRKGSFSREICPQGKGETVVEDALYSPRE
jgi:hypothetical protein